MGQYADSDEWADIVPIAQDDGGPNPLAAIAYTDEYSEAMSYLRSVMAKNEMSARAIELTEHVISMNPAHYTVWYMNCRSCPVECMMLTYIRQALQSKCPILPPQRSQPRTHMAQRHFF